MIQAISITYDSYFMLSLIILNKTLQHAIELENIDSIRFGKFANFAL